MRLFLLLLGLGLAAGAPGARGLDPLPGYLCGTGANGPDTTTLNYPAVTGPAREGGVTCAAGYADYYRAGALEAAGASFRREVTGGAFLILRRRVPWRVNLTGCQITRRLSWQSETAEQTVSATTERWTTALSVATTLRYGSVGAGIEFDPQNRPLPLCGVRVPLARRGQMESRWQRQDAQLDLSALWHQQSAQIVATAWRDQWDAHLRLMGPRGLRLELSGRRGQWIRRRTPSSETTLAPWGSDLSGSGRLTLERPRSALHVGVRSGDLALKGYGMENGLPFAKLTRLDVRLWSVFAGGDYQRRPGARSLRLELERAEFTAAARGHVEFWPFTSGWIDLLGLRRYFEAEASGFFWRAQAAVRQPLSRRWTLGASTQLWDVHPQATFSHWRPEYLVFGKADEHDYRLDVTRLLAAMPGVDVTYQCPRWSLTYALQQVAPLKTWRRAATAGPVAPASKRARSHAYGGAFHSLTLSLAY